jgi:hypothetical protein
VHLHTTQQQQQQQHTCYSAHLACSKLLRMR